LLLCSSLTSNAISASTVNPFAKRDSHSQNAVITYKVLTVLTWLLSVVSTVYYDLHAPNDGRYAHRSIWHQNNAHPSGFSLNSVIVSIYWVVLFILQLGYIGQLFSSKVENVNAACSVGSHFILNNLLHFAFVMLFVRSHFVWAEVILVINFFNLTSLYFRHNAYPRLIHMPAVSGPLAWTFVAIYWNGAIMVPYQNTLVARVFANIFVWSILVYGLFFIFAYKVSKHNLSGRFDGLFRLADGDELGLYHGFFAERSGGCTGCFAIPPPGGCLPVDLWLYGHVGSLRLYPARGRTGVGWKRCSVGQTADDGRC